MFETWSALAVFGLTLLLVMLRPRGVTESVAALVGGGLMLLLDPLPGRGPQSIPPIARFIIDHALCDILILK